MALLRHVPNVLTSLRLVAAPLTIMLLTNGQFAAALGLFAVAGISDAVDGYLAKRFNLTSRIGRFLDPLADKALMTAAFVALVILGVVPIWLAIVVFGRELLLLAGIALAAIAQAQVDIKPLLIGKVSTVVQIAYIITHLASLAFGFSLDAVEPFLAFLVAAIAVASVIPYGALWFRAVRRALRPGDAGL